MRQNQNKLPNVLMLLLSTLGILISLLTGGTALWMSAQEQAATYGPPLPLLSVGALAILIGLLNLPALVYSIRNLRNIESKARIPSLFKTASFAMIAWLLLILAGVLITRSQVYLPALAPITVLSIAIPGWWLIEFARRGLQRPDPSTEWGTLTLGLTLAPMVIMAIEILLVIAVIVVVMIILGMQPDTLTQIMSLAEEMNLGQGGLEEMDQLLYDLAVNPTIAAAIYLVIGVVAPFTEEVFKPLAVWLRSRQSINPRDGFVMGLISGGAFTLLESASLISQIATQDWVQGVVLRSATGLLHIGLSGLVGYGVAKAKSDRHWGTALLYLLGASTLHGLWNSMALLNGYSSTLLPSGSGGSQVGSIISIICMVLVFIGIIWITIRINTRLRQSQTLSDQITGNIDNDAGMDDREKTLL